MQFDLVGAMEAGMLFGPCSLTTSIQLMVVDSNYHPTFEDAHSQLHAKTSKVVET